MAECNVYNILLDGKTASKYKICGVTYYQPSIAKIFETQASMNNFPSYTYYYSPFDLFLNLPRKVVDKFSRLDKSLLGSGKWTDMYLGGV